MAPRRVLLGGAAVVVALVVIGAVILLAPRPGTPSGPASASCSSPGGPALVAINATGDLADSFSSGAIQSFGSNATSVVFGGVSYYDRGHAPFDSLPALGEYAPSAGTIDDLTALAAPYFAEGGVFPVGWNGTAWLIAGQSTVGNLTEGSAISIQGGIVTNLTSLVAPYFEGQGIWIAGWNGTGWLLGGNTTGGAALIFLAGDTVTDLTPSIPNNAPGDWVQGLGWNGSGWLVGGQGIFGALDGDRYTNLLPQSPFAAGGALAMDWNGSAWLVGGSPTGLVFVDGTTLRAAPSISTPAVGWVNSVVSLGAGEWIVSGGYLAAGAYTPFLKVVGSGGSLESVVDESACLPGAFDGGWVQYGAWAPAFGPRALLLVGGAGTDPVDASGHSAAAVIQVGG